MKKAEYIGTCCSLAERLIHAIEDNEKQITYKTFTKNVDMNVINEFKRQHNYYGKAGFMKLQDDHAASFWSSVYRGYHYYYMSHSSIYYIFRKKLSPSL